MWRSWRFNPPEKLKDGLILIRGVWLEPPKGKNSSSVKAGDEFIAIATWTENPEQNKPLGWYIQYSNSLSSFNVSIIEWTDLYKGPK